MKDKIIVRFPPSPTGPLHIGGVRTALYNYLIAKKLGGELVLRIEDTDQNRYVKGAEHYIFDSLKWMGISFTEGWNVGGDYGPYMQSERAKEGIYQVYADQLVRDGHAYYAFDTSEELTAMRDRLKEAGSSVQQYNAQTRMEMKNSFTLSEDEVKERLASGAPYVIRMDMPVDEEVSFHDLVRDDVSFQTNQLDDKILMKSDGLPTYHLANVVDDHMMRITHVIRGEEWVSSTPLHILLYRALGWGDSIPQFVHLPLILNPNGKGKMSKRQGDKMGFSVFPIQWTDPETGNISSGYREDGYEPEALMNFLALLGWNPGNDEEVMPESRLIEVFSLDRIQKSPTKFDLDKLNWFNQTYIKDVFPQAHLLKRVKEEIVAAGKVVPADDFVAGMIELLKERVTLMKDFVSQGSYFFEAPTSYNEKMVRKKWKEDTASLLGELTEKFEAEDLWTSENIHQQFQNFVQEKEIGAGKIMAPLRLALTGVGGGPGLFDIAALIGKAESLNRIAKACKELSDQ